MTRVFLLAGEPSGDLLGGALMRALRQLQPEIAFDGVGGPAMAKEGLQSRFDITELSVMGVTEIAPRYFHLKRRIAQTADAVLATQPDVFIGIDSPDFSLRVAKLIKARSTTRVVQYVAPSVWAWRSRRAEKMAPYVDQVLALFPFECAYMSAAGIDCDFVGHPVAVQPTAVDDEVTAFRVEQGLGDAPILLVLPGSRQREVNRLLTPFGNAAKLFLRDHPDVRIVIPTTKPMVDYIEPAVKQWAGSPLVLAPTAALDEKFEQQKRAAFAAASGALAASGTVSLELALAKTPMVIGYQFSWLTWQLLKRMVRLDTVTLVNLLSKTRAVPECLGPECSGDIIAKKLDAVWNQPEAQLEAMVTAIKQLQPENQHPSRKAASAILNGING
ncbi:MAG: lipid-A-disaccharide synthase [Aestuariivita sp.]|nr:lipid-A-disaccharide synthase [Aestuariivita sp.]MCY4345984.1 lipid-A-disaccharide synthase [Aestuariivita sp.]